MAGIDVSQRPSGCIDLAGEESDERFPICAPQKQCVQLFDESYKVQFH
jgi:hypothetical protein